MLELNERLSHEDIREIVQTGYSRIPIYESVRDRITGLFPYTQTQKIANCQNKIEKKAVKVIFFFRNVVREGSCFVKPEPRGPSLSFFLLSVSVSLSSSPISISIYLSVWLAGYLCLSLLLARHEDPYKQYEG